MQAWGQRPGRDGLAHRRSHGTHGYSVCPGPLGVTLPRLRETTRGRPLRNPGVGARKTPHRIPAGTPEAASPLGEDEELRPWRTVLDFGLAASPKQPPSPQPSPSRRPLRNPSAGARKTPHRFRPKTPESASPPGEGEDPPCLRGRGGVLQRSLKGEGERAASHKSVCPWPEPRCGRDGCAEVPRRVRPKTAAPPARVRDRQGQVLPLPRKGLRATWSLATAVLLVRWLPGGPLTAFRQGRRRLPLPEERVASRRAFEIEGRWQRFLKARVGVSPDFLEAGL